LSHMAAGAAAGGLTSILNYTQGLSKLSKIQLMKNNGKNSGFSKDRALRLYKGFSISVIGVMIYRSAYFGGYGTAKKVIFHGEKGSSFIGKYLVALGATSFAVLLSNPVDAVRRKIILKSENLQYKYALDCVRKLYNEEGLKAFVKGSRLSWISGIAASLNLVLYDGLQSLLFQKNVGI